MRRDRRPLGLLLLLVLFQLGLLLQSTEAFHPTRHPTPTPTSAIKGSPGRHTHATATFSPAPATPWPGTIISQDEEEPASSPPRRAPTSI